MGAALSFTFAGSDLSIVASGPGRLYVDVAGTRLPRDSQGRAYVDLAAEKQQIELVRGLAGETHAATITLGEGQVAVSYIIVDRHEGFPVALLWAAAIYACVWALLWRVRR